MKFRTYILDNTHGNVDVHGITLAFYFFRIVWFVMKFCTYILDNTHSNVDVHGITLAITQKIWHVAFVLQGYFKVF